MTPKEAWLLCRTVKAVCPQQAIDEYTPDAWGPLLTDVQFDDAKEAVTALARRQPFISPAEICDQVRRIRADRLDRADPLDLIPPRELADDPAAERRWIINRRREVADGTFIPAPRTELKPRDMRAIEGTFPRPEEGDE